MHVIALLVGIGVRATRVWGIGLQPHESGKSIIFRAHAKFFGQKPAAKNEKYFKKVFIKSQKTEFIPSSKIKCPKSGIFVNIIGWG